MDKRHIVQSPGKTTLAATVVARLNAIHQAQKPGVAVSQPVAAFVPMDGYHLSRKQLSAMPDPQLAHARRGAAFTFDGTSFAELVQQLRQPIAAETPTLQAPSFNRGVKDPVAGDIAIPACARIVMFEGNYLSLDEAPWNEAARLMDEIWFVDVDFDVACEKLVGRHVKAGIADTLEDAHRRVDQNDLVNGKQTVENKVAGITEVVLSVEDEAWAPEAPGLED